MKLKNTIIILSALLCFAVLLLIIPGCGPFAKNPLDGDPSETVHQHIFSEWLYVKGSCDAELIESRYCTDCGESETRITSPGHSYGEWSYVSSEYDDPLYSGVGFSIFPGQPYFYTLPSQTLKAEVITYERKCARCDATEKKTETICPEECHLGMDVRNCEIVRSATCEQAGEMKGVCSVCGKNAAASIPKLEHEFGEWETTTEPTCQKCGEKRKICTHCNETVTDSIPKLEHKFGEWEITIEPTCQQIGEHKKKCSFCSETVAESIPVSGHDYENVTPLEDRKCGNSMTYRCKYCSDTYQEVVQNIVLTLESGTSLDITTDGIFYGHFYDVKAIGGYGQKKYSFEVYQGGILYGDLTVADSLSEKYSLSSRTQTDLSDYVLKVTVEDEAGNTVEAFYNMETGLPVIL